MERVGVDGSPAKPVVYGGGTGERGPAGGAASSGDVGMDGPGRGSSRPVGAAVALEGDPNVPVGRRMNVPVEALAVMGHDPAGSADVAGLERCLRAVRAVRSWTDAYEAAVLAEAARCDAAREAGAVDTAGWLGQRIGVGRREALARTRTAAGLEDLPEVGQALAGGRITHGHAQVLTQHAAPTGVDLAIDPAVDFPDPARDAARRVATAVRDRQEELIVAAEAMSTDAYRRFLRRWADRAAGDDGAGRDVAERRRRSVTTFDTDDGMRGVLPSDRFAFFENELRRLAEMRWRADHPDADKVPAKEISCPQRNADALVDMARRSRQLGDNNGEPLRSHVDVMVLIDHETLTGGLHDRSRCELDDTAPLSPTAARRLLCDADVLTAVRDRKSWKLDLGYSRRAANREIRKALIARDRTCTADGCDRPHWMCEIHHIIPWADGGRTDLDNLTLLCSRHHHIHHTNETRGARGSRTARGACAATRTSDPKPDRSPDRGGGPRIGAGHPKADPIPDRPLDRGDRAPNGADYQNPPIREVSAPTGAYRSAPLNHTANSGAPTSARRSTSPDLAANGSLNPPATVALSKPTGMDSAPTKVCPPRAGPPGPPRDAVLEVLVSTTVCPPRAGPLQHH